MRQHDFPLLFRDLWRLVKEKKKMIFRAALLLGFVSLLYGLNRPLTFEAEGTFRQSESGQSFSSVSFSEIIGAMGKSSKQEGITTLMLSRKMLRPLIEELGLHASVSSPQVKSGFFSKAMDNIRAFSATLTKKEGTPVPDFQVPFECKDVHYKGETTAFFTVEFSDEQHYTVSDEEGNPLGQGELKQPFSTPYVAFTLNEGNSALLPGKKYSLSIKPWIYIANHLASRVSVEANKNDISIIHLSYMHRNRFLAANIINGIMNRYKEYLEENQKEQAQEQIKYLEERQDQTIQQVEALMIARANDMRGWLGSSGFMNAGKEIEFLAKNQTELHKRLLHIQMEENRLEYPRSKDLHENRLFESIDSPPINELLHRLRDLKQKRDSLQVALQHSPHTPGLEKGMSSSQSYELETLRDALNEAKHILQSLEMEELPDPELVHSNVDTLVPSWLEKLRLLHQSLQQNRHRPIDNEEYSTQKKYALAYLDHLIRLYEVRATILEDRLIHLPQGIEEFDGLDLDTANQLYLTYNKELDRLQITVNQRKASLQSMEHPDFELSSLSNILHDSVSAKLIQEAGALTQRLHDTQNLSLRENERLRDELEVKKSFLKMHLQQTVALAGIDEQLIHDKMRALQKVILDNMNQQLSIYNRQLLDYIETRKERLSIEKNLIEQQMREIRSAMDFLPEKWLSEEQLNLRIAMASKLVGVVSNLVESRNISHNLEKIESGPFDLAIPAITPKTPRFLLFVFIGTFAGCILGVGMIFLQALFQGYRATQDSLRALGYSVSGSLKNTPLPFPSSYLLPEVLKTLRHVWTYFSETSKEKNVCLLATGAGPDYSLPLALLIKQRNKRVAVVECSFDSFKEPTQEKALISYLEGNADFPLPQMQEGIAFFKAEKFSPFLPELLDSSSFAQLLERLKESYDWILLSSHSTFEDAEIHVLARLADNLALTLDKETLEEVIETAPLLTREGAVPATYIFLES